jgi:4-hydroxybenzoate polyprenyltransferase
MQESPPVLGLPRWKRIGIACLIFAVAAFWMSVGVRIDWVGLLFLALYFLIDVPIQKGEAPKAYFSKPRTIVSVGLTIVGLVGVLHTLHHLFPKHF